MAYDSTEDTKTHIHAVASFMTSITNQLEVRKQAHDASKLREPEKSLYDEWKPKIRQAEIEFGYGSKEYEDCLRAMGDGLNLHFSANRHHPEHFENGISGMTLVDLVEMLADWKAASNQYGTPLNLEANRKRFKMSDQLFEILQNTVRDLKW